MYSRELRYGNLYFVGEAVARYEGISGDAYAFTPMCEDGRFHGRDIYRRDLTDVRPYEVAKETAYEKERREFGRFGG